MTHPPLYNVNVIIITITGYTGANASAELSE